MKIKEMWIGQWRYLGGDDWTNCAAIGFSKEDVEAQILAALNEDVRDHNKDLVEMGGEDEPCPEYESLDDAIDQNDGELFYEVWCNDRDVDLPETALVKE